MTNRLWKSFSLLLLLAVTFVSFGCHKTPKAAPTVPAPPPPPPLPAPTITLNADRNAITVGQSAVLSYTATNATSVTITPGIGSVQPATTGTRTVNPTATTSFTARADGPGGTATSSAVNITVNPAPAPPPPVVAAPPPVRNDPPAPKPDPAKIFESTMVPVYFDYDKANIRSGEEERKLLNMASYLKQNASIRFTIEGNADERGSQEYNVALGDERAAAVKKYLAAQGVADNRMMTISYGEERPVCREPNEACWQQNRRAAFKMN